MLGLFLAAETLLMNAGTQLDLHLPLHGTLFFPLAPLRTPSFIPSPRVLTSMSKPVMNSEMLTQMLRQGPPMLKVQLNSSQPLNYPSTDRQTTILPLPPQAEPNGKATLSTRSPTPLQILPLHRSPQAQLTPSGLVSPWSIIFKLVLRVRARATTQGQTSLQSWLQ